MIGVFLPSWNRASQLKLCLDSIRQNAWHIFDEINIYYDGANEQYIKGYYDLISRWPVDRKIRWWPKHKVNGLYQHHTDMNHTLGNEKYSHVLILTDDSIFYRPIIQKKEKILEQIKDDVMCFSFRQGLNTRVVDYTRPTEIVEQVIPIERNESFMKWHWPSHTNHYGFPCALDGSLFERTHIHKLTNLLFSSFDYRRWESDVNQYVRHNPYKPHLTSFTESALVNVPANMVSDGPYCKNGEMYSYSAQDLNDKFLQLEFIDLDQLDFSNIHSVQQEIEFKFRGY